MSLILSFLIKLKNLLIKNREILLFFFASIAFVIFYPDERRFPFDWRPQSEWKHADLFADFSFIRPLSDDEIKLQNDSLKNSFLYFRFQTENPKIDYTYRDSASDRNLPDAILKNIIKKYNSKLISNYDPLGDNAHKNICYIIDKTDTFLISCTEIIATNKVRKEIKKTIDSTYLSKGHTKPNIEIYVQPNLLLLVRESKTLEDHLSIRKSEIIEKGFCIVKQGQFIDKITHERLLNYRKLYITGYPYGLKKYFILAGRCVLVLVIFAMLYQFMIFFRPNVFEDSSKLLMILAIMFFFFVIVMKIGQYQEEWIYFIPLPIVPIVLKAFYDTRLALFCHFLLLILIGLGISSFYTFFILHFTSGVFSIITVESIYKRSQLFTSVFKIIAVYIIVYFGLELSTAAPFSAGSKTYLILSVNAFLILFAFPIIYSIEKIFGMVSDLSLLELSDTNMPLLKELAEKAPGTFQHSLQVSSLAESAAAKVGANTLLVRTAALYHDIGKMSHPQFFVENQITGYNPHDELSFEESARVIIDHVKEGVKIARQRKLPESIIDFIRTHHGTTTVQYFYKMFLKNFPDNTYSEDRFRYAGPTPFSKETAILMLADSVEAACRSLAQHGADRFQMEAQIDAIFTSLMDQRQFDNANISLSEISEIRKTLKKKIINIYHNRIQYPK